MLQTEPDPDPIGMKVWLENTNLAAVFEKIYRVSGPLLEDLKDLVELRNELIHPHHTPTGTPDDWPDYLRRIKEKGLLNASDNTGNVIMLDQMASHRLFSWAIGVRDSLKILVDARDPLKQFVDITDGLRIWIRKR